jgi:uncharacterized membrane protein YphA (DoxX/SURF4 family)
MRWPILALTGLLFVQRILFGVMFVMTGTLWWRRDTSPGQHLLDSVDLAVEAGLQPLPPYDLFFNAVVLPHPALFASMAGVGELLTGLALLLGFPRRIGAVGGIILTANYGLAFGNGLIPPSGNFLLMLMFLPLLSGLPYRVFTPVETLLARRETGRASV